RGGSTNVGRNDCRVAQQASPLWPSERSAAKSISKPSVGIDRQHLHQIQSSAGAGIWMKLRPFCFSCKPVEWTDFLADVATEDPFTDAASKFRRDRSLVLDRQIADALAGIQHIRRDKRIGRTSREASLTRAAADCDRDLIGREIE